MSVRGVTGALLLALSSGGAAAQTYSNTIFFGDSNTDSGRYLYLPRTIGGSNFATAGAYTTNPGPEWSVALGQMFGIAVAPSDAPGGGNNYAAGGARVVFESGTSNAWSTQSQIAAYLAATGGRADPNALYVYWIGVNDLKTTTTGGPGNIVSPVDVPALELLASQAASQVASLWNAGARYIVVPNTFKVSSTAIATASGFGFNQNVVTSRTIYDQDLWNGIAARGINFVPADIDRLLGYVLLNPTPFGILVTNVNTPACGATTGSIDCTPANYVTPNADKTYFYADGPSATTTGGGHVTSAVQKIEADYVYSLLVAPSQISFLAEAPLKTRTGTINAILNQIPLSYGQAGIYHAWVSGDISWLKIANYPGFPDDPGTPVAVTAGFDYKLANGWLVGAAFSGGSTKQTWSATRGSYRQEEFSGSLYAAYTGGPYWANLVATAGALHDDVNRIVPLGITSQSNLGRTNGTNVSFAAELGYNFFTPFGSTPTGMPLKAEPPAPAMLKHGPVVGIVLQHVHVNGFTEFDPLGGVTALSFGAQSRDSAVTELGWQASLQLGIWQPFVKAVWNHELADTDRLVTAALTTVAAPAFSLPAVDLGKDWGTAVAGTRVRLGRDINGYVAFVGQVGQNHAFNYGGQFGVNVALNPEPTGAIVTK
jgi:outer membrane lipase/esterase